MTAQSSALADLVGSRICHDLISPIGAISNGVELISMNGSIAGPEMGLIAESVENANARIRFFRIAFGAASPEQRIGRTEIVAVLRDVWRGTRMVVDWQPEGDQPRPQVKLAFLLLQCLENAMPRGGRITVSVVGGHWAILGQAEQLRFDPELWAILADNRPAPPDIQAATVQFPLAAMLAAELAVEPCVETSPTAIRIRF